MGCLKRLSINYFWLEAVKKGKETRLATFGCQLRPPPLQIGINAKLLKSLLTGFLMDEMLIYLFSKFELHCCTFSVKIDAEMKNIAF